MNANQIFIALCVIEFESSPKIKPLFWLPSVSRLDPRMSEYSSLQKIVAKTTQISLTEFCMVLPALDLKIPMDSLSLKAHFVCNNSD